MKKAAVFFMAIGITTAVVAIVQGGACIGFLIIKDVGGALNAFLVAAIALWTSRSAIELARAALNHL